MTRTEYERGLASLRSDPDLIARPGVQEGAIARLTQAFEADERWGREHPEPPDKPTTTTTQRRTAMTTPTTDDRIEAMRLMGMSLADAQKRVAEMEQEDSMEALRAEQVAWEDAGRPGGSEALLSGTWRTLDAPDPDATSEGIRAGLAEQIEQGGGWDSPDSHVRYDPVQALADQETAERASTQAAHVEAQVQALISAGLTRAQAVAKVGTAPVVPADNPLASAKILEQLRSTPEGERGW